MEVQKEEKKGKIDTVVDVMFATSLALTCLVMIRDLFGKPINIYHFNVNTCGKKQNPPEKIDSQKHPEKQKKEIDYFEFN